MLEGIRRKASTIGRSVECAVFRIDTMLRIDQYFMLADVHLEGIMKRRSLNQHCALSGLLLIFGLFILAGCESPPKRQLYGLSAEERFGFLVDGKTTREEILFRMGDPSARYEDGRIFTYQIIPASDGAWRVQPPGRDESMMRLWADYSCSLVLVFDENGLLTRHKLVFPDELIQDE